MSYEKQPLRTAVMHPLKRLYYSNLFTALLIAALVATFYCLLLKYTN